MEGMDRQKRCPEERGLDQWKRSSNGVRIDAQMEQKNEELSERKDAV